MKRGGLPCSGLYRVFTSGGFGNKWQTAGGFSRGDPLERDDAFKGSALKAG